MNSNEKKLNHSLSSDELLTVEESDYTFDYWLNKPYIGNELKENLKKANLLLVPFENFRNNPEPVFMAGSDSLLEFLLKNKTPELHPDICIEDQNYRELRLHDITIVLGAFVVTSIAAPVLADLISEYLKRLIFKEKDESKIIVDFEMHINEPGKVTKRIRYKGPEKSFKEVIGKSLNLPINPSTQTKKIDGPKKD